VKEIETVIGELSNSEANSRKMTLNSISQLMEYGEFDRQVIQMVGRLNLEQRISGRNTSLPTSSLP
jgi:hypothetical protein